MNPTGIDARRRRLHDRLHQLSPAVLAFSGGVDSSLLLAESIAAGVDVIAVTGVSPSLALDQLAQARRVARSLRARHVELSTEELADSNYVGNSADRCFFCKNILFGRLSARFPDRTVLDGTNTDDIGDHRPGRRAAAAHDVVSPLIDCGYSKEDVRVASRRLELETADHPASPCLASRIPYGLAVDERKLRQIDRAERSLRGLGFRELRVRHFGDAARVELGRDEMQRAEDPMIRCAMVRGIEEAGFRRVTIDDRPLLSGRLNDERTGASRS